jgi:hypothetical protein
MYLQNTILRITHEKWMNFGINASSCILTRNKYPENRNYSFRVSQEAIIFLYRTNYIFKHIHSPYSLYIFYENVMQICTEVSKKPQRWFHFSFCVNSHGTTLAQACLNLKFSITKWHNLSHNKLLLRYFLRKSSVASHYSCIWATNSRVLLAQMHPWCLSLANGHSFIYFSPNFGTIKKLKL